MNDGEFPAGPLGPGPLDDEQLVARSLTVLAGRADHHHAGDRVAAVRRRARRRAVVRATSLALGAVLVAGGTGLAGSRLLSTDRVAVSTSTPTPSPGLTSPTPVPSGPASPTSGASASASAAPSPQTSATGAPAVPPVLGGARPSGESAWLTRSYPVSCTGQRTTAAFAQGTATVAAAGATWTAYLSVRDVTAAVGVQGFPGRVVAVVIQCQEAAGQDVRVDEVTLYAGPVGAERALATVVTAAERLRLTDLLVNQTQVTLVLQGVSSSTAVAPDTAVVRAAVVQVAAAGAPCGVATSCRVDTTSYSYPLRLPYGDPLDTAPFLDTAVRLVSTLGRTLSFETRAVGPLPIPVDRVTGRPFSAALVAAGAGTLRSYAVDFGDGTPAAGSNPGGDMSCPAASGGALAPVLAMNRVSHTYAKPGQYTVSFSTSACSPVGARKATVTVTVR